MSTYALKSIARRSSMFGVAIAVFAAAIIPAASAFADTLNPLTERSLLLSSSAPGYQDTDGSGNAIGAPSNGVPNGSYAVPGSGPNGKKSGQTFTFKVSSTAAVSAFTLQYCTTAAGVCQAPGDNAGDFRDGPTARMSNADAHALATAPIDLRTSDLDVNFGTMVGGVDYKITVDTDDSDSTPGTEVADYTDWTVAATNAEDDAHSGDLTGKRNFISVSTTAPLSLEMQDKVEIRFFASDTNFITNPGSGSFFVKINTYNTNDDTKWVNEIAANDPDQIYIIDGGVTVANVMTDSIHITTKVLETMSFSVGTRNRDTVKIASTGEPGFENINATHGPCDPIQQINDNRLQLGNEDAEFSLETDTAYDVYSYWRLSSNSSGGATVYYSGNTLANTVGDEIAEIGATKSTSNPGSEQFGLAFVDATADDTGKFDPAFSTLVTNNPRYKNPTLVLQEATTTPAVLPEILLTPESEYAGGTGNINGVTKDATFAFEKESNTIPRVIAKNNLMVISCATAKMRYMANIGADTPAGVYTTKINYLAAPQY